MGSPATRHKWAHPALTPARQAGTRFTYPGGVEGWVDLGDLLHTKVVYPPTDPVYGKSWLTRDLDCLVFNLLNDN